MASSKFDYKFITEPDDILKCSICTKIAKGQPMQHGASGCGKLFCKKCIKKYGNNPCPMCRGDPKYFEDVKSKTKPHFCRSLSGCSIITGLREIKALGVSCDNVDRGCIWTGTVGTLEDHVDKCGYTMVQCSKKCKVKGNNFSLMRKDLDNHLTTECPNRAQNCEYCGEEGTYASITEEHDQLCLKKPIPCPNTDCTLTMERGRAKKHLQMECDYSEVPCKYAKIGCSRGMMRKDIKQHEEENEAHFSLSLEKISQLDDAVSSIKSELQSLQMSLARSKASSKTLVIKMPGFMEKKRTEVPFKSEPFFTVPNGYKMCLLVCANGFDSGHGTHLSVFIVLLDVPYKERLHWPFQGNVTLELLNQSKDKDHECANLKSDHKFFAKCGWGDPTFISHTKVYGDDFCSNIQFLVKDILYFRVTIQEKVVKPWLECVD